MVNYRTIMELVNQIPAGTWDVLRGIKEGRPAMMLSELIECRRRHRKIRSLRNHDRRRRGYLIHLHCDQAGGSIGRTHVPRAREEAATAARSETLA